MRIAALALLAVAACATVDPTVPLLQDTAPPPAVAATNGANWLLPGTTWRLAAIDGRRFPAPVTVTLTRDGRIEGQAPCNRFTADYTGRWPDLTFDAVTATELACDDLALERAFFAAMDRVNRGEHTANGIRFRSPDGTYLDFVRA
jgi:heat shock protein HslJ